MTGAEAGDIRMVEVDMDRPIGPLREECDFIARLDIAQIGRLVMDPETSDLFSGHLMTCAFCGMTVDGLGRRIQEEVIHEDDVLPGWDHWKRDLALRQLAELLSRTPHQ